MKNIELLSPVGDFDCLRAAVQNGADAVYLGAADFNARYSAKNFSLEELEQAISDKMKELNETLELLNRMLKGEVLTYEQVQQEKEKEVQEEINPVTETPLVETSESSFFQSPFSKEEKETTTSDFIFDFNSKPLESKEEEVGFDFNSLFNSEGV